MSCAPLSALTTRRLGDSPSIPAPAAASSEQRDEIAGALGVAKDAVRVVSGDVGGNFGIRNNTCPEFVLVAWAAKRVGRPVKWVCDPATRYRLYSWRLVIS